MLPALASGVLPGSEGWERVLLRPGEHPLASLRRALGVDGTEDPISTALARLAPEAKLLLTVDQFEETFAACRDELERAAFMDALADAAQRRDGRVAIVLALRADYYGACAAHPRLSRLLGESHVLVGPMQPNELAQAIEGPARKAGLVVEPELVARLVEDVAGSRAGCRCSRPRCSSSGSGVRACGCASPRTSGPEVCRERWRGSPSRPTGG